MTHFKAKSEISTNNELLGIELVINPGINSMIN